MLAVLKIASEVLFILWTLIQIFERPGEGEQKKQQVIAKAREWIEAVRGQMPAWLYSFLHDGPVTGFLVDTLVWAANAFGFFPPGQSEQSAGQSAAGSQSG